MLPIIVIPGVRHFITTSTVKKTWTLISNSVESINNVILIGRRLPVVPLLEFVHKVIEAWNEKHNREGRKTTTTLTNKYNEMLEDNKNMSHRMFVSINNSFFSFYSMLVFLLLIWFIFNKGMCINIISSYSYRWCKKVYSMSKY